MFFPFVRYQSDWDLLEKEGEINSQNLANKRVFISRDLNEKSVFLKTLSSAEFEVIDHSLIEFKAIPFHLSTSYDWIFFYSKNAVRFFFEKVSAKNIHSSIAAFGPGTAHFLKSQNIPIHFCGSGKASSTAKEFLKVVKKQSVLFPRAKHSRKSIQNLLQDQIKAIDLVIYDNQTKTDFDLENLDILVFTSPLNARAYFKKYNFLKGQRVIAIGKTTAKQLKNIGIQKIEISESPSEFSLAKMILKATT